MSRKQRVTRRTVLRGLGAAMALPALDIMTPALAHGADSAMIAADSIHAAGGFVPLALVDLDFDAHRGTDDEGDDDEQSPLEPLRRNSEMRRRLLSQAHRVEIARHREDRQATDADQHRNQADETLAHRETETAHEPQQNLHRLESRHSQHEQDQGEEKSVNDHSGDDHAAG